jgi:DNA/RNA endonuclease G (NUC1)
VVFNDKGKLIILVFQYKNQNEINDIPAHEVTTDGVEQEIGLDFLSALPENVQKGIESTKPTQQEVNALLN